MIIVADKELGLQNNIEDKDYINFFPSGKNENEFKFKLKDLKRLSEIQSNLIDNLIYKINPVFLDCLNINFEEFKFLLRPITSSLINIFLDRALRALYQINTYDSSSNVLEINYNDDIKFLGELHELSFTSWKFNQEIIKRLLVSLNINSLKASSNFCCPEYITEPSPKNLMFDPLGKKSYLRKIYHRILDNIPKTKSSILAFGFAYDLNYIKQARLCGPNGIFKTYLKKISIKHSIRDEKIRNKIKTIIEETLIDEIKNAITAFDMNIDTNKINLVSSIFPDFYFDFFPTSALENANENIKLCLSILDKEKPKALFGTELKVNTNHGYFMSCAAKIKGIKVLGYQHGGHYGYIEDNFMHAQYEYFLYDQMITWGWDKIDDHFPTCEIFSLPVPFLSDIKKKRMIKKILSKKKSSRADFIFFSNKIQRFPQVSTCGQSRIDFINEYKIQLENLFEQSNKRNLFAIHKPFNKNTLLFLNTFFKKLENLGENNYELFRNMHKGLSKDVLLSANIIIFDQIGTGTLECFNMEIPTLVLWPRIYSKEVEWDRTLFLELEKNGVLHRSVNSLLDEVEFFKSSPKMWMKNQSRKNSITKFCNKYAKSDESWIGKWKSVLSGY